MKTLCSQLNAWSAEFMNKTKCCVSPLEMLCRAFTSASFSCCLFVGLNSVLFLIIEQPVLLDWDQVSDLDTEEHPLSLPLTMLDCFRSMFSSSVFSVKYCFLIPSFCYKLILVSSLQRLFSDPGWHFYIFLKSYLAFLFLSVPVICTVLWTLYSSIHEALVDCRLWQWQNYLHKFVINLVQRCEDVFNHVSKSLLWSSRSIDLGFFLLNRSFFTMQKWLLLWVGAI